MHNHTQDDHVIIEKKLGIPPDYQYLAIRSKNFLQANWHKNKLTVLDTLLKFTKHSAVLDLGTGSGNFELWCAAKVRKIVGVDYNDEPLKFLKNKLKRGKKNNVVLVQSDIRDLTKVKRHAPFDFIVVVDVIEHIPEKDALKVAKNIRALISKNGKVCIITPNYRSAWVLLEALLDTTTLVPKFQGHQHLAKYSKENLTRVFRDGGFRLVTFRTFNTISFMAPFSWLATFLCKIEIAYEFTYGNMIVAIFERK